MNDKTEVVSDLNSHLSQDPKEHFEEHQMEHQQVKGDGQSESEQIDQMNLQKNQYLQQQYYEQHQSFQDHASQQQHVEEQQMLHSQIHQDDKIQQHHQGLKQIPNHQVGNQNQSKSFHLQQNSNLGTSRSPKGNVGIGGGLGNKGSHGYHRSILDREERDLINLANNLSKEEIWEKLEQKRFNQLKQAAVSLQSDMIFQNRCPKCTLLPPCKHYQTQEQIMHELPHLIQQPLFKQHLSPKKREVLIKAVKDQNRFNNTMIAASSHELFHQGRTIQGTAGGHFGQPFSDSSAQLHGFQEQVQQSPGDHGPLDNSDILRKIEQDNMINGVTGSHRKNRNAVLNNTVNGAMPNGFRGFSEHQRSGLNLANHQHHQSSQLSKFGANIMMTGYGNYNTQQQQPRRIKQTNFLRKRQGNGGSPVPEIKPNNGSSTFLDVSKISSENGNQLGASNHQDSVFGGTALRGRDRTTVRIRKKNNEFLYGEASFTQPLNSTKNAHIVGTNHNNSYMEYQSHQSLQEKERLQAVIAKYREEKIQRQIEKIEEEKMKMELEKQKLREDEIRRRRYNEQLKQKLAEHQSLRQQEVEQRLQQEKLIQQQELQKNRLRRQYYEQQKKQITEYREQKRKTDELLLITQPNQQKMLLYNDFQSPTNLYGPSGSVSHQRSTQSKQGNEPISSGGLVTNAGQSYIKSGQGQVKLQGNDNNTTCRKQNEIRQKYQEGSGHLDEGYNQGDEMQYDGAADGGFDEPYYDEEEDGMQSNSDNQNAQQQKTVKKQLQEEGQFV